ncbi:hypothetical protein EVAR_99696_1 [Eumeta japonica]|uniref:Uncharacterized protein n=1 Tax=Eumeta variegata TaxID=151549 RepID=A0A4C1YER3_EUMVA|nr:hypothetical protein EVAR_99696_1 [Eumeta japonica]
MIDEYRRRPAPRPELKGIQIETDQSGSYLILTSGSSSKSSNIKDEGIHPISKRVKPRAEMLRRVATPSTHRAVTLDNSQTNISPGLDLHPVYLPTAAVRLPFSRQHCDFLTGGIQANAFL